MNHAEDVCTWSDGTWCFREDLDDYLTLMSDDYEVIKFATPKWDKFAKENHLD